MAHHTCNRLGCYASARYLLVSGCLAYEHINTRWYCTTHFLEAANNGPRSNQFVCWKCFDIKHTIELADDFVIQAL